MQALILVLFLDCMCRCCFDIHRSLICSSTSRSIDALEITILAPLGCWAAGPLTQLVVGIWLLGGPSKARRASTDHKAARATLQHMTKVGLVFTHQSVLGSKIFRSNGQGIDLSDQLPGVEAGGCSSRNIVYETTTRVFGYAQFLQTTPFPRRF